MIGRNMFSKDFLNVKFHKKCIFNIKIETHRCNLVYDWLVSIPVKGCAQGDQSESSSPWCPPGVRASKIFCAARLSCGAGPSTSQKRALELFRNTLTNI